MDNEINSKKIIKNIFTNNIYLSVFIAIISSIFFLAWLNFKIVLPSFYDEMISNFVDEAKRVGAHILRHNSSDDKKDFHKMIIGLKEDLNIEKIKIFDEKGYIQFSTDKKDIGLKNKYEYFYDIVAKGTIYYNIAHKGNKSLEGRVVMQDVAEIYIPIMEDEKFAGSYEIYYDITEKRESLNKLITRIEEIFYVFSIFYLFFSFSLLYLISKQNIKNKIIEMSIHQKAKMASMGEMIGNIAHQWRQPLSSISMAASAIKLQQDLGKINPELIQRSTVKIVETTKYLSTTIDDFRNFFKSEKEFRQTTTKELIDSTLSIVWAHLKNENISVITDIEDIKINTLDNEVKQVLLNIINNAKDALLSNNVDEKTIFIEVKRKQNLVIINIKDNAGGIPADIIDKIFDPYFTTKHQSQGTGIGLYMSLEIIEKHLNGKLSVFNDKYKHDSQKYTGAKFAIFLPINL